MELKIYKISKKFLDKEITIKGWIRFLRDSKNILFLEIYDGSCCEEFQVIIKKDKINKYSKLSVGDAVSCTGKIQNNTKNDKLEMHLISLRVIAKNDGSPLQKKSHSLEFLRSYPHIRVKSKYFQAVFQIRSVLFLLIHDFFKNNNFLYIQSPILTLNDAEGSGEVFQISSKNTDDFFNTEMFLGVSGQLYSEALAQSFFNVYTFAPTFRSDKSNTTRHAAEFWMLEPEMVFANLDDIMKISEDLLKFLCKNIIEKCKHQIKYLQEKNNIDLFTRIKNINKKKFNRISYSKAIEILKDANKKVSFEYNNIYWGMDMNTEHEKYIASVYFKSPVFIYDYPKEIKAFYMKKNNDNITVRALDLLVPDIGELIGGSERENNYDKLINEIKLRKMNLEQLEWYCELRKYGYAPSAGFGLGFERLIMYFTGVSNIKDVILFPRTAGACNI